MASKNLVHKIVGATPVELLPGNLARRKVRIISRMRSRRMARCGHTPLVTRQQLQRSQRVTDRRVRQRYRSSMTAKSSFTSRWILT